MKFSDFIIYFIANNTAQKMQFPNKDLFSKCDQIRPHLLEKILMENFSFYAVQSVWNRRPWLQLLLINCKVI